MIETTASNVVLIVTTIVSVGTIIATNTNKALKEWRDNKRRTALTTREELNRHAEWDRDTYDKCVEHSIDIDLPPPLI